MKGKLPSIVMVFVALALVLSLVAVAPNAKDVSADPGTDAWSGYRLPTTSDYQLFPDTEVGPIAITDDGTLFAAVLDTSVAPTPTPTPTPTPAHGWYGTRWGSPRGSVLQAVFYSTDGGYSWRFGWELPEDDWGDPMASPPTNIVDIVPAPGYTHPGTVYLVTYKYLYWSTDGGKTFYRTSTVNPGVAGGGEIRSLDVALVPGTTDEYVAVVGISQGDAPGVYTWNEAGVPIWVDKEIGNGPAATMKYDVGETRFSPNYAAASPVDLVIVAAGIYDPNDNPVYTGPANTTTTVVSVYSGQVGTWGIEIMDAALWDGSAIVANWGHLDFADDFDIVNSPYIFGGIVDDITNDGDAYLCKMLPPAAGPSTVTRLNVAGGADIDIWSIDVSGPAYFAEALVGTEFILGGSPTGQAQVYRGNNLLTTPTWVPSLKPPSGSPPTFVVRGSDAYVSTFDWADMGGGMTASGVSKLAPDPIGLGMAWNGVGLLDETVVTMDLFGDTYLAAIVYEEVSPHYAAASPGDQTLFIAVKSYWTFNQARQNLSLWRTTDGGATWERVLCEWLLLPPGVYVTDKESVVGDEIGIPSYSEGYPGGDTWSVRVTPDFNMANAPMANAFVFLLGGMEPYTDGDAERLWYSVNGGDLWAPVSAMPATDGAILSETGWCVVDPLTVLLGDDYGYVYKTVNRGNSWTDGVVTYYDSLVTDLNVSPIYSETGDAGTDKAVLAGVWTGYPDECGAAQVWLSQDGAEEQFVQVGRDIVDDWYSNWMDCIPGKVAVNFDADWGTESPANTWVYAGVSGFLSYYTGLGELFSLEQTGDAGVYRTEVNLADPDTSMWEQVYGFDDIDPLLREPTRPGERYLFLTDLTIGHEGTIYVPFGVYEFNPDIAGMGMGLDMLARFILGGALRSLDGTIATTEWDTVTDGLPNYRGLWLLRAVPGTNHLFSVLYEWEWMGGDLTDYDLGLVTYEDTLCQAGPAPGEPLDDATNIGEMVGTKVNVVLDWASVGSTIYQWQVDDGGFTAPMIAEGTTSETFAQVTGLENAFQYYWRVRVIDPVYSPWSAPQSFTTVIGTAVSAPELLSPEAGATGVALRPTFQWGALGWATSYLIQVATDAGFTDLEIDETATVTAYQPADELDSGTTYYWRVKATSDTAESGWSVGLFTAGPVGDGEPTPYWVWVVIAIGVILAVALLVLIIRTRRPA